MADLYGIECRDDQPYVKSRFSYYERATKGSALLFYANVFFLPPCSPYSISLWPLGRVYNPKRKKKKIKIERSVNNVGRFLTGNIFQVPLLKSFMPLEVE